MRLQDGKVIYDGDSQDPQAVVQPEEEAGSETEDGFGALVGEEAAE